MPNVEELRMAVAEAKDAGHLTAPQIHEHLRINSAWNATLSQVRRALTAVNAAAAPLDAEAKAARRKSKEKARDQLRDRTKRARPAEERERLRRNADAGSNTRYKAFGIPWLFGAPLERNEQLFKEWVHNGGDVDVVRPHRFSILKHTHRMPKPRRAVPPGR